MDDNKNQLLEALVESLAERVESRQKSVGYKHDLPAGFAISTNLMHGPTGIFGAAGMEPYVFSTRVVPRGLLEYLPAKPTVDTNPVVAYLTGFTDESGTEPNYPCDEPPIAGSIKSCTQGSLFGHIQRKTQVLEINKIGRRTNRGEFMDLSMVNDPIVSNHALMPNVPKEAQQVLNNEVWARWMTLGVAFENKLGKTIWTGNPINSSANNGYVEFSGLEALVTTTHTDVLTNTNCPSLASDIKDFRFQDVNTNSYGLFLMLTMLFRYVKHNAETMNFLPVEWAIVMQDALFRMVCDVWPCVYANARCSAGGNATSVMTNVNNAMDMRTMSDEMYNGRFLWLDGLKVPVIVDDYIPYDTNATQAGLNPGEFASDIYILPLSVKGRFPVTFMEYFDYSSPNGTMAAISAGHLADDYWTDGGKFLWSYSRTNWCVSWIAKIEPRLRLLTPHLAGRLMNVRYSPLQMFRMPDPDDAYFVDGGVYAGRTNSPYYADRYQ
jgi:hypothetical protein